MGENKGSKESNTEKYLRHIRNLIIVIIVFYIISFIVNWLNEAVTMATYK